MRHTRRRFELIAHDGDELEHRLRLVLTALDAAHGRVLAVVRKSARYGQAGAAVHYVFREPLPAIAAGAARR